MSFWKKIFGDEKKTIVIERSCEDISPISLETAQNNEDEIVAVLAAVVAQCWADNDLELWAAISAIIAIHINEKKFDATCLKKNYNSLWVNWGKTQLMNNRLN